MEQKTFHSAFSTKPISVKGNFVVQGAQVINNVGGVPELVGLLFEKFKELDQVVLNRVDSANVFTRFNSPLVKLNEAEKPQLNADKFKKLLEVAGFKILRFYHITNQYDKRNCDEPWLLAFIDGGEIVMGWRKNVISISWNSIEFLRGIVTDDEVTKDQTMVHAYSEEKALTYLNYLFNIYNVLKPKSNI